ncbi:MAG: hypothetical protein EPO21_13070 [Chloroflexota bacterium]|nr:MAG: hypothetical protein EPO21_13070 [Chloroflexota bacterium]
MVDISQFLNVGALATLILILLQLLKGRIKTDYTPYVSILIGVVLMVLFGWIQALVKTPSDLVTYALSGLLSGLLAVGGYEASIDKIKLR